MQQLNLPSHSEGIAVDLLAHEEKGLQYGNPWLHPLRSICNELEQAGFIKIEEVMYHVDDTKIPCGWPFVVCATNQK